MKVSMIKTNSFRFFLTSQKEPARKRGQENKLKLDVTMERKFLKEVQ
jgi:hypothetical protein